MSSDKYSGGGLGVLPVSQAYGRFVPYTWPQDNLAVPSGFNSLTPIDLGNRYVSREFFGFAINTSVQLSATTITRRVFNLPIGDYGDFWMSNIRVSGVNTDTRDFLLTLTDVITGYNVFTPNIHALLLAPANSGVAVPVQVPMPQGSVKGTLPMPNCFTRNGAMQIGLEFPATVGAPIVLVSLVVDGWREYTHASQ